MYIKLKFLTGEQIVTITGNCNIVDMFLGSQLRSVTIQQDDGTTYTYYIDVIFAFETTEVTNNSRNFKIKVEELSYDY